jgi:hypothetical protein
MHHLLQFSLQYFVQIKIVFKFKCNYLADIIIYIIIETNCQLKSYYNQVGN